MENGARMTPVHDQMREEWNERAREDAHYYVAFGRRGQDDSEFFATAQEILTTFYRELRRETPTDATGRRFLEIGCGPGRLMKPLSSLCGEIHGVDVSEEMIARAKANLAGIAHAFPRAGTGSTLDFPNEHFDFVYSYAVFQHIPSREVVFSYLRETIRVLKWGGIARLQLNGLPKSAAAYTTWAGVRIDADEIREFAREQGIQLLALEGLGTQYMWTTWRKAAPGEPGSGVRIRRVTNAFSTEPAVPVGGRFSALSAWVEGLSETADLNTLALRIAGRPTTSTYIGQAEPDGLRQVNALLPPDLPTGIAALELAGAEHRVRLVPKPPSVPRVMGLTDGVDLMSVRRVSSGVGKLSVEEFEPISAFRAEFGGREVTEWEAFCVDPAPPRHEVNFKVPKELQPGQYFLRIFLGNRQIAAEIVTIS
jgi:SAM-dependent methyltransferase